MADSQTAKTDSTKSKSFSLSDLTRSLERYISKTYSGTYRIVAELNKLNHYVQSGHCYPKFVEKKQGRIVAEMPGFISRWEYEGILARFQEVIGRPPEDGMEVLMRCRVQFDSVRGLSLKVLDIDPSYTMGEMHRQRQEAIRKLREEGLFDANKAHHLPMLVKRLAVISVVTSKGWQDFSSILDRSPYGPAIRRELFPSILQGDAAVDRLSAALSAIESRRADFDAVAIIRGGGGETGLDCFDNYVLAKKISTFPLPVLTGVGHAANLTVCEQVAYRNLITPSELAHFILHGFREFDERVTKATRTLQLIGRNALSSAGDRLDSLGHKLSQSTRERTHGQIVKVSTLSHRLETYTERITVNQTFRLTREITGRLRTATDRITQETQRLEHLSDLMPQTSIRILINETDKLKYLSDKVEILDPVRMMKRGFSMVTAGDKTITDAAELKPGDTVSIKFAAGDADAEIRKTNLT